MAVVPERPTASPIVSLEFVRTPHDQFLLGTQASALAGTALAPDDAAHISRAAHQTANCRRA